MSKLTDDCQSSYMEECECYNHVRVVEYRKELDEQSRLLSISLARVARLEKALGRARDTICSEFCGSDPHHDCCKAVEADLNEGRGEEK